jgi:hypothetical protein
MIMKLLKRYSISDIDIAILVVGFLILICVVCLGCSSSRTPTQTVCPSGIITSSGIRYDADFGDERVRDIFIFIVDNISYQASVPVCVDGTIRRDWMQPRVGSNLTICLQWYDNWWELHSIVENQ